VASWPRGLVLILLMSNYDTVLLVQPGRPHNKIPKNTTFCLTCILSVRSLKEHLRRVFYRASAYLAMQNPVLAIRSSCPSICLSTRPSSVCHTLALSQNDASYDHEIFTDG